ncbi:hypothetical protein F2Q68_00009900 [Brassica cretica]|uniref:Uncharacterized protein n=1 Tax=Brassica cretica TaxID=69181 RepID=A0A8S9L1I1_BRACR|nr:hypothetical protein F2Q68_00009900 [Brassica cretica]
MSVSFGFSLRLVSNLSLSRLRPSRLRSSLSVRLSPSAVRLVRLSPSAVRLSPFVSEMGFMRVEIGLNRLRLHLKPKTDTVSLINIPSSSTASLTSETPPETQDRHSFFDKHSIFFDCLIDLRWTFLGVMDLEEDELMELRVMNLWSYSL